MAKKIKLCSKCKHFKHYFIVGDECQAKKINKYNGTETLINPIGAETNSKGRCKYYKERK